MATVTRDRRNDIAKLLTTLATPCGNSYSERDWHKCQRCRLIEELSQRNGLVFDLLREGAAALAAPPASAPAPAAGEAERRDWTGVSCEGCPYPDSCGYFRRCTFRRAALTSKGDALLPASPQAETKRDCTCLGSCRGAEGLSPRYRCVLASPQAETTYRNRCYQRPDGNTVHFVRHLACQCGALRTREETVGSNVPLGPQAETTKGDE